MKKNKLQKEYKDKTLAMYFKIAIIGSIICFVGDMAVLIHLVQKEWQSFSLRFLRNGLK